jgi:hypothetical protein
MRAWATATAAVLLAMVLAGGSTVAAAGNSMPGETLYPVKLATEQVQIAFTFSDIDKAELYNNLAEKRVDEIVYVANKGDSKQVEITTKRLDTYLNKVAVLVEPPVSRQEKNEPPVTAAPTASRAEATPMMAKPETLPTPVQAPAVSVPSPTPSPTPLPPAAKDTGQLRTPSVSTRQAVPVTPSAVTAEKKPVTANVISADRKAVLKENLKVKSAENVQRLREALEKAPEQAKPALKKAIEQAESGYKKVLEEKKPEGALPAVPVTPQNITPAPRPDGKIPSAAQEQSGAVSVTLTPIPAPPLPRASVAPVSPKPTTTPAITPAPSPVSRQPIDSNKKPPVTVDKQDLIPKSDSR